MAAGNGRLYRKPVIIGIGIGKQREGCNTCWPVTGSTVIIYYSSYIIRPVLGGSAELANKDGQEE